MPLVYKFDVLAALKEKGYNTNALRKDKLLAEGVIQSLRENKPISWANIEKLCKLLECQPGDLIEYIDLKKLIILCIKRFLSIVLVTVMTCTIIPLAGLQLRANAGTNGYTRESAAQYMLNTILGTGWNVDGGGVGYDCKDLALKYFADVGNLTTKQLGNAEIYANSATLPDGWTRKYNSDGYVPQKGDMACWGVEMGGGCGHVALIYDVDNTFIYVVEQSSSKNCAAFKGKYYISSPKCFVVPDFEDSFEPSEEYANLGDDFYGVILNTGCWKPITQDVSTENIILDTEYGIATQKWHFTRQEDGSYIIGSCYDGKVLEMTDGIQSVCSQLTAHDWWGGNYQQWYLIPQGEGYIFQSKHFFDENWVMDLYANLNSDKNIIQINTRNNSDAQIWSIYTGDEVQLKSPTLSISLDDSNATFDWNDCYGASYYDLKIYENEDCTIQHHIEWNAQRGYSIELQDGIYYVYVCSCDYYQFKRSEIIRLVVGESGWLCPSISVNKYNVYVDEGIQFEYSGLSGCSKVNICFKKNGTIYYKDDSTSSTVYSTWFENPGTYECYFSGLYNDVWYNTSAVTIIVKEKDIIKPTAEISSTNNVASTQIVTILLSDNDGLQGYYWGNYSSYANNTYYSVSDSPTSQTITKSISSSGTFYLTVKDLSGNISSTLSKTFYKIIFDSNCESINPIDIITLAGSRIDLPTPTRTGYTFTGWYTSASGGTKITEDTTCLLTADQTLYAHWEHDTFTPSDNSSIDLNVEKKLIYGENILSMSKDDLISSFTNSNTAVNMNGNRLATGSTISLLDDTNTVYDTLTVVVFGDTNGDSWYDGQDAMVVNCIVNGMLTREQVGEAIWAAADCNHDGVIDQLDVDLLNQAGLLLSQVDQTKPTEELQTSSVYQEYLSLIDQSSIDENEPAEDTPTKEKSTLTELIWKFILQIFEIIKSWLS